LIEQKDAERLGKFEKADEGVVNKEKGI